MTFAKVRSHHVAAAAAADGTIFNPVMRQDSEGTIYVEITGVATVKVRGRLHPDDTLGDVLTLTEADVDTNAVAFANFTLLPELRVDITSRGSGTVTARTVE